MSSEDRNESQCGEKLTDGNVSEVIRVGDTVRRTANAWTATVHDVLNHVHDCGVNWVPKPLGLDQLGREILSYIPGVVPHDMPPWIWEKSVLSDVAIFLSQWHQATLGCKPASPIWGLKPREPEEVICHNDFAPYNCVFQDRSLVGVIDFDTCAPGPRLWDISYSAYRFVPLMPTANNLDSDDFVDFSPFKRDEIFSRLSFFLEVYAKSSKQIHFSNSECIFMAMERLKDLSEWTLSHAEINQKSELKKHAVMYLDHAKWISNLL